MSILQEYEVIKRKIGKEKFNQIEKFLKYHGHYILADVYYKKALLKSSVDFRYRWNAAGRAVMSS